MPVDPNRASFVQQEFRFEEAEDQSVRAIYQTARQYTHLTNLTSSAVAQALANAIFAEARKPASAFKVEIEGYVLIDTIDGGPLRYEVTSDKYGLTGQVFKVAGCETDPLRNKTVFEVRG